MRFLQLAFHKLLNTHGIYAEVFLKPFQFALLLLCKTQYWKYQTNNPSSQFPRSCVCERFMYCHDGSAYSAAGKYVDRSWEYIYRKQTHECGNWDWGRTIPFLAIYKWDFRCSVCIVKEWRRRSPPLPSPPHFSNTGKSFFSLWREVKALPILA